MKVIGITQARIGSSRLPEKVLKDINGKSLLQIHLERLKKSSLLTEVWVATTYEPGSSKIEEIANNVGARTHFGSTENVLDRFYTLIKKTEAQVVVRFTSDCPLIDHQLIDLMISKFQELNVDYLSNTLNPTYPDGMDIEIFTTESLVKAWEEAELQSDEEHVTPYIWRNSTFNNKKKFKSYSYEQKENFGNYRMTVDHPEDFDLINKLITRLGDDKDWIEYVNQIKSSHDLFDLNSNNKRNEGYEKSRRNDNDH